MKKELSRDVIADKVIIIYDDGSQEELVLDQKPPENINADADIDTIEESGHTFSDKTLNERGHI